MILDHPAIYCRDAEAVNRTAERARQAYFEACAFVAEAAACIDRMEHQVSLLPRDMTTSDIGIMHPEEARAALEVFPAAPQLADIRMEF